MYFFASRQAANTLTVANKALQPASSVNIHAVVIGVQIDLGVEVWQLLFIGTTFGIIALPRQVTHLIRVQL